MPAAVTATDLWEKGIDLRDAPARFAPARLKGEARTPTLPKSSDGSELTGGMKMLADNAGWDQEQRRAAKQGLANVEALFDDIRTVGVLNYERARYVANLILSKKAIAVGFSKGSAKPEIIPAYLFATDAFIKWNKNEVAGNGLTFITVKVAKLRPTQKLKNADPAPKIKIPKKPGRPSSSKVIEIIHELNRDPKFRKLPRKVQTELVIKKSTEKHSKWFVEGKGLASSTVARYLHQELGGKTS